MEPLAPGMRRVGKILRRLSVGVAEATPEQLEKRQSAPVPELVASVLLGRLPRGVNAENRDAGSLPVRVYSPKAPPRAPRPLVVYIHGGGFVFGDLRGGDWMCGTVCCDLDAIVVSIQYRLAPGHPFPAAVDDCYRGLQWVADHAEEWGADANRLGVMGDSAGGNLSAVVCLTARDRKGPVIRHQTLLYPVTGAYGSESRRLNADAYVLTAADIERFDELYAGDKSDWRVSPLLATTHEDLPSALIIVAAHDPLHDDGTLYADALSAGGTAVKLIDYPAMPHGFLSFPRFARDAKRAMAEVVAAQRAALTRV